MRGGSKVGLLHVAAKSAERGFEQIAKQLFAVRQPILPPQLIDAERVGEEPADPERVAVAVPFEAIVEGLTRAALRQSLADAQAALRRMRLALLLAEAAQSSAADVAGAMPAERVASRRAVAGETRAIGEAGHQFQRVESNASSAERTSTIRHAGRPVAESRRSRSKAALISAR